MGTVNDILQVFISLSSEERKRLVMQMQEISLRERGEEANRNLQAGKVKRGSAQDLIRAMHTETIANLHIEKLPEGVYLATSDDIPGLLAQGRTLAETIEIARDVARKLIEAQAERKNTASLQPIKDSFDYPLILGTV